MNSNFFAQIEPQLKKAGYNGTIDDLGYRMTVKKGRQKIDIMHSYEEGMDGISVGFRYCIRSRFLKQLSVTGRIVLANLLSFIHPSFNIAYQHRGCCILVRYNCNMSDPNSILYHLFEANERYDILLYDLHRRLPAIQNAFPYEETPDKQLEKTIDHLQHWRIENIHTIETIWNHYFQSSNIGKA